MTTHDEDIEQRVNPAKLADDVVLALSSLERGAKVSPESLDEGRQLCDYLIHLLAELRESAPQTKGHVLQAIHSDSKTLDENGFNNEQTYQKTEEVKKWIGELMENPSSHSHDEIDTIKEYLITITMPMWQNRTSEFRERKMKRSLVIRG